MSAPVVSLRDATVQIAGHTVWSEVDVTVGSGEFVAVLGPNGVGKSTLIKAILGLVPLAGGEMRVLGQAPGGANDRIGYLPQRRSFDAGLRIRGVDIVRMGLDGDRWGVPWPGRRSAGARAEAERVAEVIDLVGATAYADRPIGQVSGGEQQRLLIAQALVPEAGAAAARRAARQPRPAQPGVGGGAHRRDLRRGRGGDAGGPRRQPDPVVPRPGHLPRPWRRRRGTTGRGDHQRDPDPICTARPSRCCARATVGSWSSASPRRPPITTRGTRDARLRPARPRLEPRRRTCVSCSSSASWSTRSWPAAIVALVAAPIGWFMVLRRQTFAGHTLAVVGFPGAAGAVLLGVSASLGYFGLLRGRRPRDRRRSPRSPGRWSARSRR